MSTTPTNPTSNPRTRGKRPSRTITAAEALPGVVLLPHGITEADPTKALPLVIEKLNAAQAENQRLQGDLAVKCSEFNTAEAYLKTVRAALDCNDETLGYKQRQIHILWSALMTVATLAILYKTGVLQMIGVVK